jgi:hypothetical protein
MVGAKAPIPEASPAPPLASALLEIEYVDQLTTAIAINTPRAITSPMEFFRQLVVSCSIRMLRTIRCGTTSRKMTHTRESNQFRIGL